VLLSVVAALPSDEKTVVVIGGGIGGLTLALALRQAGFPVQVYEQAPELAEVGAGITLWYNAVRVLEHLDLAEAVRQVGLRANGGVIALHDGRMLVEASLESFAALGPLSELLVLHRAELQRALYDRLPPGTVRFNCRCTGYAHTEAGAVAHFEGRASAPGWLVVGADGLHSSIRAQLKGPEPPRYAGYICWRGVCPVPADWCGTTGEIWGKGDRFGVARLPGDRLYWFAVANAPQGTQSPAGAACKEALLQRFARYAFDVPRILAATPVEAIIFREISDRRPVRGWSDGSVTLLGDAVHPTTPNMGQGAAMAMESALVLVRCLREHTELGAALRSYEATRAVRTQRITNTSWTIGKMAHWESSLARRMRNLMFERSPRKLRERQLREIVGYDAGRVPLAGG